MEKAPNAAHVPSSPEIVITIALAVVKLLADSAGKMVHLMSKSFPEMV